MVTDSLKKLPIGIDDFKKVMERNSYFVDKSLFIEEIIENISEVILFTRPRRFGKTLNLSMLKCFLEIPECRKYIKEDRDYFYLFEKLNIYKDKRFFEKHFGKYPVLNFSFKKIKGNDWETAGYYFREEIAKEYKKHSYLLSSDVLLDFEKKQFKQIMSKKGKIYTYTAAIYELTSYLKKYYGKNVIVLIDEYDTPLHYAKLNGYYDEMLNVMRALMVDGMKGNENLEKAVITGIMKISQESIFSSFNNPEIASINKKFCADKFGFTEYEVLSMLKYYGLEDKYDVVQKWYNGYLFGGNETIYNPWSILNYVKDNGEEPEPYWINTGDTTLIKKCLQLDKVRGKEYISRLYRGYSLEKEIEENIVYEEVFNDVDKAFSYLLHTGYLKGEYSNENNGKYYLSIPNNEILKIYESILKNWFKADLETDYLFNDLSNYLVSEKIEKFEAELNLFLITVTSYYDTVRGNKQVKLVEEKKETEKFENFYHGLMLGLMINIGNDYYLESNKEYGLGRPDLVILPKDKNKTGYIMEFKNIFTSSDETVEAAARRALDQIEEKKYEKGVKKTGINEVLKLGLGFKGKECRVLTD